jgi:hypothetical protein
MLDSMTPPSHKREGTARAMAIQTRFATSFTHSSSPSHVTQVHSALLDEGGMSLLAMPACPRLPLPDRALIQPKGRDNRLQGAAVTKQNEHHGHQVGRRA